MKEMRRSREEKYQFIDFEKIIDKQSEVIQSLSREILLLKSYISLEKTIGQYAISSPSLTERDNFEAMKLKRINQSIKKTAEEDSNIPYEFFFKQVSVLLNLQFAGTPNLDQMLESIKKLKEQARKKNEPIFVERIKQVKVPITVQKIVERQVQKIIQKIVYIQKPIIMEKVIEKPIFKQKIIQKFVDRRQQENQQSDGMVNKTYSEKNLRNPQRGPIDDKNYYQRDRGYGKNQQDNFRPDVRRNGDSYTGANLVKKRDLNYNRYGSKRDNY